MGKDPDDSCLSGAGLRSFSSLDVKSTNCPLQGRELARFSPATSEHQIIKFFALSVCALFSLSYTTAVLAARGCQRAMGRDQSTKGG
jgi:hypothetical protein